MLTIAGLLAALLWDEIGKYVAWVTVGLPVLVVAWVWLHHCIQRRPRSKRASRGG